MNYSEKYEAVIGLEVHAQLSTKSKIFCSCLTDFGSEPNTHVCPVCLGLPGTLPTLNGEAVRLAVLAGLALNCKISPVTGFDRKNYFYPDLPKAYQITQNERPICREGYLDIMCEGKEKRIGIKQIHMEEDAGKLIHKKGEGTFADYNRCGVPLIEIVSKPDMSNAAEARAYLTELRTVLLYAGISDCKMNEGSLRCDVNLSVRKRGATENGVRTEIKNINSFAFAAKAIEFEFARQARLLESGESVISQTRRFDLESGETHAMRDKETAADYRFFPEPDLPPFAVSESYVDRIRAELPLLPCDRRKIYREKYDLSAADSDIIIARPEMAEYFDRVCELTQYPKIGANLMITRLLSCVGAEGFDVSVSPEYLSEIATLFGDGEINSSTVKRLIDMVSAGEGSPRELVKREGMAQIRDEARLRAVLLEVIEESPKLIADYIGGRTAAKKAIIGKAMAKTGGRAEPLLTDKILDSITSAMKI